MSIVWYAPLSGGAGSGAQGAVGGRLSRRHDAAAPAPRFLAERIEWVFQLLLILSILSACR